MVCNCTSLGLMNLPSNEPVNKKEEKSINQRMRVSLKVKVLVAQLCLTLCDPMDCQAPLSMGFSRQEYWSGLPFPSPGDLPNSGIEPGSPALQADSLLVV